MDYLSRPEESGNFILALDKECNVKENVDDAEKASIAESAGASKLTIAMSAAVFMLMTFGLA